MTLAERLRAALRTGFARPTELLAGDVAHDGSEDSVPAAVLIAVTDRPDPGVILTQRTDQLRSHAGQIAFPGGRIDFGEDAVTAALREAYEEVALHGRLAEVIAPLDGYRTITGYAVTPVLAVVPPDLPLVPAEAEVALVFETPLAFLLDPANMRTVDMDWRGRRRRRHYRQLDWQGHKIWGATAAMIVNLSRRLQGLWPV